MDEIGDVALLNAVDQVAHGTWNNEGQPKAGVEVQSLPVADLVIEHGHDRCHGDPDEEGNANRIREIGKDTEADSTVLDMGEIEQGGQKRGDSKKRPRAQYEEMGAKSAALRAKRKKGGK